MIIEYVTLGLYLGLLLVLGVVFSKFNTNLSDFVRGGAQGTWWLVGTSVLMAGISAFTFTGNASAAFEAGPTFLIIYAANVISYAIGGWFLGAWMRQTRAYTVADLIRSRFGTPVEQFSVYTGVFLGPIGAAIQLWALAVFASSVFGFPLIPTIITIGCIVIFYSTTGGKWAVMATDFVQGMILFSITILVAVLALIKIGGLGEFFSYFSDPRFSNDFKFVKEPGQFPDNKFTWHWIIVIFFMQIQGQISLVTGGRYLACKDGREARRASWLAAILMAFGTAIWFFPPMVARFIYGDQIMAQDIDNPANSSYAFIALDLLPTGLMGIMIAAMFAATMSSMDSGLNGQVGAIARNMIPRLRGALGLSEELPAKTELIICKVATLILGAVILGYSCLFAMQKEIVLFDAYLIIGSVIGIPLGFPFLVGLWIKKLPSWSYFWIFGACLIPSIISFYDGRVNSNPWTIQERAMWIFIAGTIATVACMPFFKYSSVKYRNRIKEFFEMMHTPVDYAKEIGASRDYSQLYLIGNTVMFLGSALLFLLLIPNDLKSRLSILFVSGFILSIGLLLRVGARLEQRRERRMLQEAGVLESAEAEEEPGEKS